MKFAVLQSSPPLFGLGSPIMGNDKLGWRFYAMLFGGIFIFFLILKILVFPNE